ncbi:hypothetical protein N7478_000766 [Penicillium angulare]|uniref:uncharacterized protein n=1 Tax=Penicillium angulare TaxID=116970 RepID=UPI00254120C3|nr:uncharacterized protein N7478_000766 [Penicillium angulare]KAJ5291515.1 hypothetical protein N7478_000766 [Penicillium angulare]
MASASESTTHPASKEVDETSNESHDENKQPESDKAKEKKADRDNSTLQNLDKWLNSGGKPPATSSAPSQPNRMNSEAHSESECDEVDKFSQTAAATGSFNAPTENSGSADSSNEPPEPLDRPGRVLASTKSQDGSQPTSNKTKPKGTASSLNTPEGAFPEVYCKFSSWPGCCRIVFGYGEPGKAKYEIGDATEYAQEALASLPLISGKKESVLDIRINGARIYGRRNIGKVTNVASLTPNPDRERKPRVTKTGKVIQVYPPMLIKIQWIDIQESHRKELFNSEDWNVRSNITKRLKNKDQAWLDEQIGGAAKAQDQSYEEWAAEKGIDGEKRPPTFFPGKGGLTSQSQGVKETAKAQRVHDAMNQNDGAQSNDGQPLNTKKRKADSATERLGQDRRMKFQHIPNPPSKFIDYNSYLFTCMMDQKLTHEKLNDDPEGYQAAMEKIEIDWAEYKKLMLDNDYEIRPGGDQKAQA